ncbi:hypothetical protein [Streptomyces sp. NPDC029554]|uniref:hypothetical protein n=1 Tax=Streptomyces sp. NPDC029554 TaxID=3155126 RepID=UPI0033C5A862
MSRYPSIYAGQRITGTLLQSMLPNIIQKLASTDRSSTTTLADDPDLTTTLEANARYLVEMEIWYAASTGSSGLRTAWTVPSGVTGNRSALGMASTVSDTTPAGIGRWGVHAYSTTVFYGDRQSSTNLALAKEVSMVTTGSSAGTLALQWAQDTSSADACRVGAGSVMRVTRLA